LSNFGAALVTVFAMQTFRKDLAAVMQTAQARTVWVVIAGSSLQDMIKQH
jgi:hypothetical protein